MERQFIPPMAARPGQNFASEPRFRATQRRNDCGQLAAKHHRWRRPDGVQPYYTLNGGTTWNPVNLPGVTSWSGFEGAYYLDERSITADRVLPNTFYLYYPGKAFTNPPMAESRGHKFTAEMMAGQSWNGNITAFNWYNNELNRCPAKPAISFLRRAHGS